MNNQINTNEDRAERALHALREYKLYCDEATRALGREETIGDLLIDLMHLCDLSNISFDEIASRAHGHHRHEVREEWRQDEELVK